MEADRFLGSTNENFFKKVAQLNGLARAIYLLFILFMRVGKNTLYIADKSQTHKSQVFFTAIIMWVGKWGEPFLKKTFCSMHAASLLRDHRTGFVLRYNLF